MFPNGFPSFFPHEIAVFEDMILPRLFLTPWEIARSGRRSGNRRVTVFPRCDHRLKGCFAILRYIRVSEHILLACVRAGRVCTRVIALCQNNIARKHLGIWAMFQFLFGHLWLAETLHMSHQSVWILERLQLVLWWCRWTDHLREGCECNIFLIEARWHLRISLFEL